MAARQVKVVKPARVVLLEQLKVSLLAAIGDARDPDRRQPAAVAALSKELRAVQVELDQSELIGKVSVADELAQRSAARRAGTADRAPAARRGQPRRSNGVHRTG